MLHSNKLQLGLNSVHFFVDNQPVTDASWLNITLLKYEKVSFNGISQV